jgi:hypothetical protein
VRFFFVGISAVDAHASGTIRVRNISGAPRPINKALIEVLFVSYIYPLAEGEVSFGVMHGWFRPNRNYCIRLGRPGAQSSFPDAFRNPDVHRLGIKKNAVEGTVLAYYYS